MTPGIPTRELIAKAWTAQRRAEALEKQIESLVIEHARVSAEAEALVMLAEITSKGVFCAYASYQIRPQ